MTDRIAISRLPRFAARSLHSLKVHQTVDFRGPAPERDRAMHDPDTTIPLEQIRIYDGDELIFHGSDPSTYTVCTTAEELEAAFAAVGTESRCPRRYATTALPRAQHDARPRGLARFSARTLYRPGDLRARETDCLRRKRGRRFVMLSLGLRPRRFGPTTGRRSQRASHLDEVVVEARVDAFGVQPSGGQEL